MDPATIAVGLATLLSPYVKKAAEEFAGEAGKYAAEKAKGLWDKLKTRFEGDPPAKEVLDHFASDPDGHREQFQTAIERWAAKDPALANELSAALADIKRAAPHIKVVQEMKEAEEMVGVKARRLSRGDVDVAQKADKVGKATGVELDDIG